MTRILIVECMQEISSFNPLPSGYENFHIRRGAEMYEQRGVNQAVGGALSVFEASQGIEVVPAIGARAGSAGLLSAAGWKRLSTEIMDQVVRQHSYWVDWPMQRKPSEYFGRNVFVTGLDDVEGFRQAKNVERGYELIARWAMFSIDYPHEISLFGSTRQVLAELSDGVDADVKHALLAGNAMRVYNLTDDSTDSAATSRQAVAVR